MNANELTTAVAGKVQKHWLWPAIISLLAFAANSIFCRLALMDASVDPHSFTAIRLLGGSLFLLCLLKLRRPVRPFGGSWKGGLSLFVYAYLFSIAYLTLGAGAGALILFGAVQITMFVYGWFNGEGLRVRVVAGMLLAFAGLIALLLPGADAPALGSALLMVVSGIAWGAYSLIGKGSINPLADTAGNFMRSVPLVLLALLVAVFEGRLHVSLAGLLFGLGSGVFASGAGYVIWYGVVKRISAQQAATLQLCVPVIASVGGVVLLDEPVSLRLGMVSVVVLSGVAMALTTKRRPNGKGQA